MKERWFFLTLLLISIGIRGSSCFRIRGQELGEEDDDDDDKYQDEYNADDVEHDKFFGNSHGHHVVLHPGLRLYYLARHLQRRIGSN